LVNGGIDFDWPESIFPVSNVVGPFVSVAVCAIDDIFLKIIVEPRGTVTVFGLNALSVLFCMRIMIVTGGFGVGVGLIGVGVGFLCGVGVGVTGVGVGVGVSVTVIAAGVAVGLFVAVWVRRDGTN
jgi:uncharacterized membrane protein YedE/YeeE